MDPDQNPPSSSTTAAPAGESDSARPDLGAFEEEFDLRWHLLALGHQKWLIVFCLFCAVALALLQLRNARPVYEATTTLKYDPHVSSVVEFRGDQNDEEMSRARQNSMDTQANIIVSQPVMSGVILALGLDSPSAGPTTEAPGLGRRIRDFLSALGDRFKALVTSYEPESYQDMADAVRLQQAVEGLQKRVEVEPIKGTALLAVTVADAKPRQAARLADEVANQYLRYLQESRSDSFQYSIKWLRSQLEETKSRLEAAEKKLYDFQGQTDQHVLDKQLDLEMTNLASQNQKIEDLKRQIADYEAQIKGLDKEPDAVRKVLLDKDPEFAATVKRLADLKVERAKLAAENEAKFPAIRKIDSETKGLEEQIKGQMNALLGDVHGRLKLSRLEMEGMQQQQKDVEKRIADIQRDMTEFRVLQRDSQSITEVYNALLQRSKEIDVSSDIQPSYAAVINKARIPLAPSSPKVLVTLAVFAILGLGVGVGVALAMAYLDRSIKNPRQVEALHGLANLGAVPYIPPSAVLPSLTRKRKLQAALSSLTQNNPMQNEAFRLLRTSLHYSTPGRPPQVILVTSSLAGEGKSTVSLNLAKAFSRRDAKTLIIDADLKAPVLHKIFQAFRAPGVTDVLTGQVQLDEAIRASGIENLSYMTAGRASPATVELLESRDMADLVQVLRDRFTTIIIDSAPLMGMADTMVLSRLADGVCIVVSQSVTRLDQLAKAIQPMRRMKARLLGAIYNAKTKKQARAGVRYGYGYGAEYGGHGYGGYGYGYKDDEEPPTSPPSNTAGRANPTEG